MSQRFLVLGSGLVAGPAVDTLLDQGGDVTIGTNDVDQGHALLDGHEHGRGRVETYNAQSPGDLDRLLPQHDVVVSLLPPPFHPRVAEKAIEHRTPMVTASYVSPEMRELEARARDAGVRILGEMGLDPGLDHMSALALIGRLKRDGHRITGFSSYCGGLPATNDNAMGYKFSWSPAGVVNAAMAGATFLRNGQVTRIEEGRLFDQPAEAIAVGGLKLEGYPNRDALKYRRAYDLEGVLDLYRGTLRYPGWSAIMRAMHHAKLFVEEPLGATFGGHIAQALSVAPSEAEQAVHDRFGEGPRAAFAELGLFEDRPFEAETVKESLVARMVDRLSMQPGEQDLVAMLHVVDSVDSADQRHRHRSSLLEGRETNGPSAMAKTVGWPVAYAALLLLDPPSTLRPGVHIPTHPDVYRPILERLTSRGLRFEETSTPIGVQG